jgi:peptide/nickel transport system permease protein
MPRRAPSGMGVGLVLVGMVMVLAVFAGVIAPIDPLRTGAASLEPPSPHHLLGTDELGRDLWSNIAYGARVSLLIGTLATSLATVAGLVVGMLAGYYGRGLDEGLMRVAEVFQIIPAMLIALLLVAFLGGRLWTLIPVIALSGWPVTARIVRSEILSLREREFVLGARALGGRDPHIMRRHLLPNVFPPVLIGLPSQMGRAILLEAGLSFLGLGDPAAASWGKLLQSAQEYMREAWWLALFPGAALTATVLALYLVAEGLHARTSPGFARHVAATSNVVAVVRRVDLGPGVAKPLNPNG